MNTKNFGKKGEFAGFIIFIILYLSFVPEKSFSQSFFNVKINPSKGLTAENAILNDGSILEFERSRPLVSCMVNGKYFSSDKMESVPGNGKFYAARSGQLKITFTPENDSLASFTGDLVFENTGDDTLNISNVVPFGQDSSSVYITGNGDDYLARASIFRPGFRPVRVILPDNAWELGYSSVQAKSDRSLCSLTRRQKIEGGQRKRFETILPKGAKVTYRMYSEISQGPWQNGLRLIFRDKYLYDLKKFDNSLYERKDLDWIKDSYLIILSMAWDREFYDRTTGKYTYGEYLRKNIEKFGRIDVYGIWPTWPRLGLDQRNQWDLYRDLPGGTRQLQNFARMSRLSGTRFFIAYNPWDNSTRKEDHFRGMAKLISEVDADGVVLDTRGSSSYELQAAADSVKSGVIMYSEGMAVVKDMPGIIAGRVHNAIYMSPEINLNKLIKPDFSIFRVCDAGEDIIHREIAIAFFNGYGSELNMYRPGGRNENFEADLDFLARTTFILRQNNDAFLDPDWTPLVNTLADNVFVNEWKSENKTVFTILNMRQDGFSGPLFKAETPDNYHYVSLWNHENPEVQPRDGSFYPGVKADGWPAAMSGTRSEASVDCIARFPDLLKSKLKGDSLSISGIPQGKVLIWKGNPSYSALSKEVIIRRDTCIRIKDLFGYYEGKVVIQLLVNDRLADEDIVRLNGGKPWLVSKVNRTPKADKMPGDMILVPGARFSFRVSTNEDFMPYPDMNGIIFSVDSFLIDKYPVTNEQYYQFTVNSGYIPADTTRYLRHWESGTYKQGQEKYPVVNISYEDMQAYAKWAQKRLPTQAEWQLAAQGTDNRIWPWGNEFHATYCNNGFDRLTPVDAFPKGQSAAGVMDLVGNIWQTTNDMYFNGTDYFTVIRGGSYYRPDSSWWYIQGGPQQLDKTQIMLLVSPGFDRSATVGFRCVKDIDKGKFKVRK